MIFLIIASVLTALLLFYLVWLIKHLVNRADAVFDLGGKSGQEVPTFDFARYEKLFGPITPDPSTASSTTASSTGN